LARTYEKEGRMLALIIVVAPILVIAAVGIGVLSLSASRGEPRAPVELRPKLAEPLTKLVFVPPLAVSPRAREELPIEQVLLSIEQHLRREREAAAAFAKDPSVSGLSVN
jgi:hypothetical protein